MWLRVGKSAFVNQPKQFVGSSSAGLAWLTRPYQFLRERSAAEGETFTVDLGRYGQFVMFSNPSDIREIFAADSSLLHAGQGNAVLKAFLGGGSLLLLEEGAHQRERRLLQTSFHGRKLALHADVIAKIASARVDRMTVGETLRVQDVMQEITLEVISVVVFGELPRETYLELTSRLAAFLNDSKFNLALIGQLDSDVGASPTWDAFRGSLGYIRELLAREVVRRRAMARDDDDDMLSMLLSARYADGTQMSDESLVDELLTMVVTGYETTATALAWALYWTHREERTLAWWTETARALEPAAAHSNEQVASLCREVLRLHPVIPVVARRAQRAFTVGGRTYEPGTVLAPCIYLTHHREDLYPDPDAFRPDRFLARSYASHEYLPFGGGARRCIGMGLALMEMGIVLTVFAQRLVLELVTPEKLFAQRRSVTVAPSQATPMRVTARRS